jgi:uncharacterized protein YjbJ (UPF0337 family)
MKGNTKNKIKGIVREAKGEVEQALGNGLSRPDLKAIGWKDRATGRVQRQADNRKKIG